MYWSKDRIPKLSNLTDRATLTNSANLSNLTSLLFFANLSNFVNFHKPDKFDAKIKSDFKEQFVSIVRSDKSEHMLLKVINSLYPLGSS